MGHTGNGEEIWPASEIGSSELAVELAPSKEISTLSYHLHRREVHVGMVPKCGLNSKSLSVWHALKCHVRSSQSGGLYYTHGQKQALEL